MKIPDRASSIKQLENLDLIDVVIVGGGINGAGLFRELAVNGIPAVLIDKNDFASGATAASSRMIHGGLRYLENGEVRLVRESILERDRLLQNAPHAVQPLPTTIPILSYWSGLGSAAKRVLGLSSKPRPRGLWLITIGLSLYDLFAARRRVLPKHTVERRNAALARHKGLRSDIVATATYHDAMVKLPERLCLEIIDDAISASPSSIALNYCALAFAEGDSVAIRDQETGLCYSLRPRIVVNAAGAWIDEANSALGTRTDHIGGTKGSHLVIDHPDLAAALGDRQIFFENEDGRICILFNLNGRTLAGSTDIRISNPDDTVCSAAEVQYILESIRSVFPTIDIEPRHIVSTFCGIRPLPASGVQVTAAISRDHQIIVSERNELRRFPILSLVGGKWTSFRAFGEQAADAVMGLLGRQRQAGTEQLRIGGQSPAPTDDDPNSLAEACRSEAVVHLDDLLLRRTAIGLFRPPNAQALADLASIAGQALGWSEARIHNEISRTREILTTRHGVNIAA